MLDGPSKNGQFVPDAVIGISNGGLIVADLVGRRLFRGTPILSLWANRFSQPPGEADPSCWYFDNIYNKSTMDTIKTVVSGRPPTILLLDDHLGTGHTARQAITYLRRQLGERTIILFIPLVSKRLQQYIEVSEEFLPHKFVDNEGRPIFKIDKNQILDQLNTKASLFPYLKEISSGA